MRRGRFTTATIAALAAAAALGAWAGTAVAAPRHAAGTAPIPRPVVFTCAGHAEMRPGTYILTCADDNNFFTRLSWTSWTSTLASATGSQWVNGCIPNCAEGTFHSYPVDVIFWRSEPVAHPAYPFERDFTRITVLYPGARPAYYVDGKPTYPQTWTGSPAI